MAPILILMWYTLYMHGFVQRNSVSCGLYMWSDLERYTALEVRAALAISYRLYSYIQLRLEYKYNSHPYNSHP